jgi:hypothetical protein
VLRRDDAPRAQGMPAKIVPSLGLPSFSDFRIPNV